MKGCLVFVLTVQTALALGLFILAEFSPVPIDIPVGGWVVRLGADRAEVPEATITPLPTLTPTPRPTATATAVPTATARPTATVVVVAKAADAVPTPALTQADTLGEMKVYLAGATGLIAAACIAGALLCWRLLRREPEVVVVTYDADQEQLSDWQEPGYTG